MVTAKKAEYPSRRHWDLVIDMLDVLDRLDLISSDFDANIRTPFGGQTKFEVWVFMRVP